MTTEPNKSKVPSKDKGYKPITKLEALKLNLGMKYMLLSVLPISIAFPIYKDFGFVVCFVACVIAGIPAGRYAAYMAKKLKAETEKLKLEENATDENLGSNL